MNIFRLIFENLRRGTVSYRMPHKHVCTSDQYRGLVHNDAERCVGCGACAYVCPTAAIEVKREGDNYSWSYDPGKCTFCARCLDRCKLNTMSMESKLPPIYSTLGELKTVLNMVRKRPAPKPAAVTTPKPEVAVSPTLAVEPATIPPPAPAVTGASE